MLLPVEILDLIVQQCLWLDLEDAVPCFSNLACSCRLFLELTHHYFPQLVQRVKNAGCYLPMDNLHQLCLLYLRPTKTEDIPCIPVIVVDKKEISNMASIGNCSDFYYCPDTKQVCWKEEKRGLAYWTDLEYRRNNYSDGFLQYKPFSGVQGQKPLLVHSYSGQKRTLYIFQFSQLPAHFRDRRHQKYAYDFGSLRSWYRTRHYPHCVEIRFNNFPHSCSNYDIVWCKELFPVTEVHDLIRQQSLLISKKLVQAAGSMERNKYIKLLHHIEKELE